MSETESQDTPLAVLHLEDSGPDFLLACRALNQAGLKVHSTRAETLTDFCEHLRAHRFDLVIADYHLPGFTAQDAHELLLTSEQKIPMLLLSGAIGEATAVAAIQAGMADFVPKNDLKRLGPAVQRALATHAMQRAKALADAELTESRRRLAEFAGHLQNTVEEERASIAREIHDGIGGALAALRFDLAWLERRHKDADSQSHLRIAQDMLGQAVAASQDIMRNLRPAVLDQGLAAALEWLAQGFVRRTLMPVHTHIALTNPATRLTPAQSLTAYRTAQEAFTNIHKHAQATEVWLEAHDSHGLFTLEVRDNGMGLPPPTAVADLDRRRGFGLQGLRERAQLAGGWLDVSSHSGQGLCITLSIPLTESPPPSLDTT
jgi:signal transduction histidine kinase